MQDILNYFINLPLLELTAMLLALAYVILAAKGSLWCWPAAFISTALYTYIFYDVLLLMDSALNGYYLVMAVYGYWCWQYKPTTNKTKCTDEKNSNTNSSHLPIVSWQLSWHIKACIILAIIASALGYFMANNTNADFPYLDTFTTVYAVFATYLVTQKVLENWLYWIIIDLVSIYLYIEKSLFPTAVLFVIYVIIAAYGYVSWRNQRQNSAMRLDPALES